MSTKARPPKRTFLGREIGDAVIMAVAPVIAYIIVFAYYAGYFGYFNIPLAFISFDLTQVFLALAGMIVISLMFYQIGRSSFNIANFSPAPVARRLKTLFAIFIFFLATLPAVVSTQFYAAWKGFAFTTLSYSLFADFAVPIFLRGLKGPWLERLEKADKEEAPSEKPKSTHEAS